MVRMVNMPGAGSVNVSAVGRMYVVVDRVNGSVVR